MVEPDDAPLGLGRFDAAANKRPGMKTRRLLARNWQYDNPHPSVLHTELFTSLHVPQSLVQNYLHLVFSTKSRRLWLKNPDLRSRLHEYLGGICHGMKCPSLGVGGVEDHVHVLCQLGRTVTISDCVATLKRDSAKWLKANYPRLDGFQWQSGYGGFSVSPSHVEPLRRYIANQEAHHRTESFQDELRRLLKKYRMEFDEAYLWD